MRYKPCAASGHAACMQTRHCPCRISVAHLKHLDLDTADLFAEWRKAQHQAGIHTFVTDWLTKACLKSLGASIKRAQARNRRP